MGVGLWLWGRPAVAHEVEAVRLEIRGAGCPSVERFFDEVRWRTARVRLASGAEVGRTFDVEVKRAREKYVARFQLVEADGSRSAVRTFAGTTCEEVISATALVAALSVDPRASTEATKPKAAAPVEQELQSKQAAPTPPPTKVEEPSESEGVVADRESMPSRPSPWRWFAGAHASVASAGEIDALGSGRVQVGVRNRGSWLGPELRVGVGRSLANELEAGRGTARVQWTTANLQLCSLHVSLGARFELGTCANGDVGQLSGEAAGVQAARSDTRTWVAVGGRERLSWNVFGPILAELEVGADVPVTRDEFVLDPNVSIYRPPAWMPVATFGIGARFP